ncbi:MAG: DUF5615 family PIN-like protein [Janthinobacterium lividum]
MIRLLFDECMSPRLVGVAQRRGFDATHVNFLGLASTPDRLLLPVIAGGDYTFVTNNRVDFLRLYRHVDVHAGLLIVLPSRRWEVQIDLVGRALDAIKASRFDTVNQLIEVAEDGSVTMSAWPFDGNAP